MISMALVGAAVGALLFTIAVVVRPPKRSAAVHLGRYYAHYRGTDTAPPSAAAASHRQRERAGMWLYAQLSQRGIEFARLRSNFALTGQSFETLMGRKVLAAVGGFVGSLLALAAIDRVMGAEVPVLGPLVVGTVVSAACFVAPDIDVHKAATKRRREFTEQLAVFLDLVSLQMAGHAAAAAALPQAAQRGGAWPMLLIRDTLWRAQRSSANEWIALSELGSRIGVPELRDLGALIKLVADDGAQVRSTLAARAASMRRTQLSDEESSAEERTQSMRLAQMLIALGFMLFVGYPAFANINF